MGLDSRWLPKEALGPSQNEAGVNGLHPYRVPTDDLITTAKSACVTNNTGLHRPEASSSVFKHLGETKAAKHFIVSGHRREGPAEATPHTSSYKPWAFNGALKTSWTVAGFSECFSWSAYSSTNWQHGKKKD